MLRNCYKEFTLLLQEENRLLKYLRFQDLLYTINLLLNEWILFYKCLYVLPFPVFFFKSDVIELNDINIYSDNIL